MTKELDKIIPSKTIKGLKMYNARDLKNFLNIKKDFTSWIKVKLKHYNLIMLDDNIAEYYLDGDLRCCSYKIMATNTTPKKMEYYITYECLCDIVHCSKKTTNMKPILDIIGNNNVVLKEREEIRFLNALKEALTPLGIVIKQQYYVDSYRIDAYIEELRIAIEYDEEHHNYQKDADDLREKYLKQKLDCEFVRCSIHNSTYYNIGLVMKKVLETLK